MRRPENAGLHLRIACWEEKTVKRKGLEWGSSNSLEI